MINIDSGQTERNVWNHFIAGSTDAFAELYQRYVHKLFLYGLSISPDREVVKDAIHDVFVKLYQGRKEMVGIKNVQAYLFTLLRNKLIDEYRKNQRIYRMEDWSDVNVPDEDTFSQQEQEEERRMDVIRFRGEFKKLSEKQQQVLIYRFMKGMAVGDIAEKMGIQTQSISNLIQRALAKLRSMYAIGIIVAMALWICCFE